MKLQDLISNIFIGYIVDDKDLSKNSSDEYFYLTVENIEDGFIKENEYSKYLADKKLRKTYPNFKNYYILEYGDVVLYTLENKYDLVFYENTINKKVIPGDDLIILRTPSSILVSILQNKGGKQFFLHEVNSIKNDLSGFIKAIKLIDIDDDILLLSDLDKDNKPLESKINLADVKILPRTTSLSNIISRLENKEINIFTDFQRQASIWKSDRVKSRFIESILINFFPLPYFYFDASENEGDNDKWLIIDGLQRIKTIKEFIVDKTLRLDDLEYLSELNGKSYDELDGKYKRILKEREITFFLIYKGTPEEVRYSIFNRLNQAEPLNRQEIRNALNPHRPYPYIKELVESKEFKEVVSKHLDNQSIERREEHEIALRYIAFRIYIDEAINPPILYKEDIEDFLDYAMKYLYELTKPILNRYKIDFQKSLRIILDVFEDSFFLKTSEDKKIFNKVLFEIWLACIAELSDKQRIKFQENVKNHSTELILYKERINTVFRNNFYNSDCYDKKNVDLRFKIVHVFIKSLLDDKRH